MFFVIDDSMMSHLAELSASHYQTEIGFEHSVVLFSHYIIRNGVLCTLMIKRNSQWSKLIDDVVSRYL